jgi:Aspartyl protease/PDZ domain
MNLRRTLHIRLLTVAALAALCAAGRAQDARPTTAAKAAGQAPVARVPFEMNGNSIYLQARVNGSEPRWFVLDTGAGVTVLNATTAGSLGLKAGKAGTLRGAGGVVQSTGITGLTLDVGGAVLKDVSVTSIPLAQLENAAGRAIDGILGVDFFRRYVVEIDYEARQLTTYEPAAYGYAGRGETLPLTFRDNHPHLRAQVKFPGRPPLEGDFVIDAGSSMQLTMLPAFTEKNRLRDSVPVAFTAYAHGVGGDFALPVARAETLRIGGFTVERPVTAFPTAGTFGADGIAGNIGTAILRRFKVVFDYSRKRLHLEPSKNFSDPFEFDMSGLGLASEGPSFSVFKVARVLPDTPASEAGLRQGDEILAVGGRPVNGTRLSDLRERLRGPDQTVSLRVRRGAEELDVIIRTRRLV